MLFITQAFASNLMPCESMSHNMSPSMQHANMSHEMSPTQEMDCCEQDCSCPVGACVNLALMTSDTRELTQSPSGKVLFPLTTLPDPFQTPLNKPPISI